MSENALLAVQCIFGNAWRLFNSWKIPGTNISPAMWFIFILVGFMGFKLVFSLLGMSSVFSAYNFGDATERRKNDRINSAKRDFYNSYGLERKYDSEFANSMAKKDFNNWKNLKGY